MTRLVRHLSKPLACTAMNTERLFEGVIHLTYFGWLFYPEMTHTLGGASFSPLGMKQAEDDWLADSRLHSFTAISPLSSFYWLI